MKKNITTLMLMLIAGQYSIYPLLPCNAQPGLNFKMFSQQDQSIENEAPLASTPVPVSDAKPAPKKDASVPKLEAEQPLLDNSDDTATTSDSESNASVASETKDNNSSEQSVQSAQDNTASGESTSTASESSDGSKPTQIASKVLQGYIRVVPSGTKVPIIMDAAIDSDTSQEGDEFSARTSEDLNIDGVTVVPAGSIIRGRIAQMNAPRALNRSGSVALKFDTITTPDNRQLPIVANIVARGGVVHAKRGLKDVSIDTATFTVPTAVGLGIGLLAGASSSSSISSGGGALIGAGVGAAVGMIILAAKKGKKIDLRPGDELKIELAEDLRMPM